MTNNEGHDLRQRQWVKLSLPLQDTLHWLICCFQQPACLPGWPLCHRTSLFIVFALTFCAEIHVPVTPIRPQILEGSLCILFIFDFAVLTLCLVPVFQVHDGASTRLAWLWPRVLLGKYKEEAVVGKEGWGRRIYTTINRGVLTLRIFYGSTWTPPKCISVLISRQVYCLLSNVTQQRCHLLKIN